MEIHWEGAFRGVSHNWKSIWLSVRKETSDVRSGVIYVLVVSLIRKIFILKFMLSCHSKVGKDIVDNSFPTVKSN